MRAHSSIALALGIASAAALAACNAMPTAGGPVLSGSPQNPPPRIERSYSTDALVFDGTGTWSTEVANLENILGSHGASYELVSSAELNGMSVEDLEQYGVLIFPGGNGASEADSLTRQAHANLREAVQQHGVGYVGFCAGAFIAVAPAPAPGGDVSYGLGIFDAPELDYYYLENQGTDIAMTLESFPDGSTQDLLWYGGPVTPEVPGGVIARYPDGNPAITEMYSGYGLVVASGPHPTANQATLSALGVRSSDGTHQELAWELIQAAMTSTPLPAF
jgi:glutamine amidotransferase-like uncharacterized protein